MGIIIQSMLVKSAPNALRKLLTPRWIVRHVLVLVVFIILINLGLWQLRRLEQRRAFNNEITTGLNQPPLTLAGREVDAEALHLRRVSVSGEFDNEEAIVIRNRPLNGQPGVDLVVPLRITGSDRAVLINRGWIPLQAPTPGDLAAYAVTGPVTIKGIAYRSQPRPDGFLVPTDPTPQPGQTGLTTWFRVDIERIQQQVPYPLLPIFVEQSPDEANPTPQPPLSVENIVLTEGSHLSYAMQWFSFGLILVVTYVFFVRQELRQS